MSEHTDFEQKAATWDTPERKLRAKTLANCLKALLAQQFEGDSVATLEQMTLIDVGCGTGLLAQSLPASLRIGVDPSAAMRAQAAAKGMEVFPTIAQAAQYLRQRQDLQKHQAHAGVDMVVSSMALHHIDDPVAEVQSWAELLRPGGIAAIFDLDAVSPRGHSASDFHGDHHGVHHHGFERETVVHYLEQANLNPLAAQTAFVGMKGSVEYSVFLCAAQRPLEA